MMRSHTNQAWQETNVGRDRVLERAVGGARFLFALGPARSTAEPEERLLAVVEQLGAEVQQAVWGRQVHGPSIASVASGRCRDTTRVRCAGTFDGLMTDDDGLGVTVWTADCVPLLLAGGGVVSAIHAGWRGAAAGIADAGVARFRREFGVPADALSAALGPAVSGDHYPVGPEVIAALRTRGVDDGAWRRGRHVDLRGFLRGRLQALGVERVELVGGCTFSSPELASYRRDGQQAGRQWSMAYRAAGA